LRSLIPKPKTGRGAFIEVVATVALAFGLALLVHAFVVTPYQIPTRSMEPTLDVGQRILVDQMSYRFSAPQVGDIAAFHPPEGAGGGAQECGLQVNPNREACPQPVNHESDMNFVKRIVAGPGDTLSIKNGHPVVNGAEAKEPFINPCNDGSACNLPKTITIPPNDYFMMGDNRGSSDDSRFWGPVPRDWIIGEAFFTYWPPDRVGFL
jgi:signal peptidase I